MKIVVPQFGGTIFSNYLCVDIKKKAIIICTIKFYLLTLKKKRIMENHMFELALRKKLRFNYKGSISTEELLACKETDLNSLYDYEAELTDLLNKQGTNRRNISMTPERELNELRLKIVTYVIDQLEIMKKERIEALERTRELNRLYELKERKKLEDEGKLTTEEVDARIALLLGK